NRTRSDAEQIGLCGRRNSPTPSAIRFGEKKKRKLVIRVLPATRLFSRLPRVSTPSRHLLPFPNTTITLAHPGRKYPHQTPLDVRSLSVTDVARSHARWGDPIFPFMFQSMVPRKKCLQQSR